MKKLVLMALAVIVALSMIGCPMDETDAEGEIAVTVTGDTQTLSSGKIGVKPGAKLSASYTGSDVEASDLEWQWFKGNTPVSGKSADYTTATGTGDLNATFKVQLTIKSKTDPATGKSLVLYYPDEYVVTNLTVAQFKYAGTWVGKEFTSSNGKKYTETVVIDEDKFNLTNIEGTADVGEHMTFAVTKWDAWPGSPALSVPSGQNLPSGFTVGNGWILTGTMTSQSGYDNYTRIIMFLSDDGKKFIRGTVSSTGGVNILQNEGRVFERPTE